MANRRFEMYQYRQILVRMRMGESNRAIANSGLMGRKKAQALRERQFCMAGWIPMLFCLITIRLQLFLKKILKS